jgi:predicted nucleic acid-binding protein
MQSGTKTWLRVPKRARHQRGLLDTSAVVDLESIDPSLLPSEVAISSITLAELAAGPNATDDLVERSRRQDRVQRVEATFDPIPFGVDAARAYGRVFAAVASSGRKPRGARAVDMLIASVAVAEGLPLYTRNAVDFAHIEDLADVVAV